MFFDRITAKQEAKRIIRETHPSPVLVTIAYLLLTTGLGYLVGIFSTNPFSDAMAYVLEGYDPVQVYAYVFGGGGAIISIFISILLGLYNTVMAFGYSSYILSVSRREESGYRSLLDGFGMIVKVVVLDLVTSLVVALGIMFFVVPGIILSYSYAMAVFCLLEDPDISVLEAMRRSRQMMRGQKMHLFVVQLSFFGWVLLVTAVSGLLFALVGEGASVAFETVFHFWLTPYMSIVTAQFYNSLIGWNGRSEYTGPRLEF